MKIITLLTDFGLKDPYAGIMKGVIFSINPDVTIVDITHEVEPQDIREGAFIIAEYYRYFPDNTIHLCVVDPTVGSDRRPIIVSYNKHLFVGPDNGLFSLLYKGTCTTYSIDTLDKANISATFHGRDVFAPVAARLSTDLSPAVLGGHVTDPVHLGNIEPVVDGDSLTGEVVRFDRFGNAITNIHAGVLGPFILGRSFMIRINGMEFTAINKSYFENDYTCLFGSAGYLEFGHFRGSFARTKDIQKGDRVSVTRTP